MVVTGILEFNNCNNVQSVQINGFVTVSFLVPHVHVDTTAFSALVGEAVILNVRSGISQKCKTCRTWKKMYL